MATVTITGNTVRDAAGIPDNRPWKLRAATYQDGGAGSVITPGEDYRLLRPVAGRLTFDAEAGIAAYIENPDGARYLVSIPDEDTGLWVVIEAGIAYPPDTDQELLDAAIVAAMPPLVAAELEEQTGDAITADLAARNFTWEDAGGGEWQLAAGGDPIGDPTTAPATTWSAVADKPAVIGAGADAEEARTALGGTAVGGDVFTAADAEEARTAINAHPLLPAGYFTAADKSDGALTTLDSGQAWSAFGNYPGAIVDGEVVHTPVGTASTAAYYQAATGTDRPTRILCKGYWPNNNGNDNASLTFVVPISAWGPVGGYTADNPALVVAGIHSSFYRNGIHKHSRWDVGTQTVYGDSEAAVGPNPTLGRYAPVAVGESVWIEIWIDYDTGTLTFFPPGGGAPVAIQDDAISDDTGPWVVWEQFEYLGTTAGDAFVIEEMHFDTQVRRRDSFVATKLDLADTFAALASDAYSFESTVSAAGTKVMTSDSGTFQLFTGSTTHTLQLPTTDIDAGTPVIVQNASTGAITITASNEAAATAMATGQTVWCIALVNTPTTPSHWLVLSLATINATQTLTSKRIDPRVTSTASASSLSPNRSVADIYQYTALAANLTIGAPYGSNGGQLLYRIKDNGVSRTLTWDAAFRPVGVTLPSATTVNKMLYVTTIYNAADTKWDVIDVKLEA